MKCPHCDYINGWSFVADKDVQEREGGFYKVSNDVGMERSNTSMFSSDSDRRALYGCPKCRKLFMGEY